jgi:hypothetical protein
MPVQDKSGRSAVAVITLGNGDAISTSRLKLSHAIEGFDFELGKNAWGQPQPLEVTITLTNPRSVSSSLRMHGTFNPPARYIDDIALNGGEAIHIDPHLEFCVRGDTVTYTPTCSVAFGKARLADKSGSSVRARSAFTTYCKELCSRESTRELRELLPGLLDERKEEVENYQKWREETLELAKTEAESLGLGRDVRFMTQDVKSELRDEETVWTISRTPFTKG